MEVNEVVDVGQIAFLSTSEQVADEFRNRELSVAAKLVEKANHKAFYEKQRRF